MNGPAVMFVPGGNPRALAKAATLDADALIYDLEDSVAPAAKGAAREALREALDPARGTSRPRVPFAVRVNALGTQHFDEDLLAARALSPDAIVLPKVESPDDLTAVETALAEMDAPDALGLWAMIETPRGLLDVANIAAHGGRLRAFIVGPNDLAASVGVALADIRTRHHAWLFGVVLAARAHGLVALDGVMNGWDDALAVEAEARDGAALGFDGKTLIHPAQIAPTRAGFAPTEEALDEARAVVAAFDTVPDTVGVVTLKGRMVERLHLAAAQRVLARRGENEEKGR